MRKWWIVSILLISMFTGLSGCSMSRGRTGNWQSDIPQMTHDAKVYSKMLARVALRDADLEVFVTYLVLLKDILAVSDRPNFDAARRIVPEHIPEEYRSYGFTIIDIIESYFRSINTEEIGEQETMLLIINACIEGFVEVIEELQVSD